MTRYRVVITFVDSSYWDDGSRYTSRTFKFDRRKDAIAFAKSALSSGLKIVGLHGEVFVIPNERDLKVFRDTSVLVNI